MDATSTSGQRIRKSNTIFIGGMDGKRDSATGKEYKTSDQENWY